MWYKLLNKILKASLSVEQLWLAGLVPQVTPGFAVLCTFCQDRGIDLKVENLKCEKKKE